MIKIKNVINKIVTKDEVNACYLLVKISSHIIFSEIDVIRSRNVILHQSQIILLILNVLGQASKNWQTIRIRTVDWIIAKVIFVRFTKWLGVLRKNYRKKYYSLDVVKQWNQNFLNQQNWNKLPRSRKSKPRLI